MNYIKNICKDNSKLLIILTMFNSILSLYALIYFGYQDRMTYQESIVKSTNDLVLLIQNMYTSTWWALIILSISLISILTITSIIYKKECLHFMSILLWIILFILSLDFTKPILYNLSGLAIFIPIILLNIKAYYNQKKVVNY